MSTRQALHGRGQSRMIPLWGLSAKGRNPLPAKRKAPIPVKLLLYVVMPQLRGFCHSLPNRKPPRSLT